MAREDQQGPRCRNSWRPSDGPPSQEAANQQRSPVPPKPIAWLPTTRAPQNNAWRSSGYNHRLTPTLPHATPEPPPQTFKNPNLIPVVLRRSQISKLTSPAADSEQDEGPEEKRLPQIWHPYIDDLIRRTAQDYDLIMNYERDAEGGQRWLPEDIATIRDVGKHLHGDISALRRWQRVVADQGDQDKNMMMQIKRDANFLKLLCERVQRAINKYEQKCEFELLRDGVYAQDEDGNFYKPTAPQHYVAETGFLHDVARPSIENTGYDQSSYHPEEYHDGPSTSLRRYRAPPEAQDPPDHPLKRNLAFDVAFQQTPFDKIKAEATRQKSDATLRPTPRRPDKTLDGRISKTYQNSPPARKRRTPSPTCRDRTPDSGAQSGQLTSYEKTRSRGRNNRYDRNGASRRQAKRDRARDRHPSQNAGLLGKHVLHY